VSKSEQWDQRLAERIVARTLGGKAESRDVPGAPDGTHDFDLLLPDGRVIAVEVTRYTESGRVQQVAEIRRWWADEERKAWIVDRLSHGWHVTVGPEAHIRRLHAAIGGLLQVLEQKGLRKLRTTVSPASTADEESKAAVSRLHDLGVWVVWMFDSLKAGEVVVVPFEAGGSTGQDLVSAMVEAKAGDKVKTLAGVEADERHVFIWVEVAQQATMGALAFIDLGVPGCELPNPTLPEGVDAAWVVEALFPARIRLYRRVGGWMDYGEWSQDQPDPSD
jgi:hypothetical protein